MSGKQVLSDHAREVWVRHTYDPSDIPQRVSYFKRRGIREGIDMLPPPLYPQYPIPIKKAKADDLCKLLPFLPADFYTSLPTDEDSD